MNFEEFQRYKEKAFVLFCRTVIQREGVNQFHEFAERSRQEVSLSSMSEKDLLSQATMDKYELYCRRFIVCGQIIPVYDCDLGEALGCLNHKLRNALLLFHFFGYNDTQIGQIFHISRSAVRYRRTQAMKKLKSILEDNA